MPPVGYVSAGTFEFLLGPDGEPYFIEVNCRLQVEHPVSELVTGIDLVREQLRIAAGEPLALTGRAPRARARDRDAHQRRGSEPRDFAPAPGTVTRFRPPLGPGVRVDTAVVDGGEITPYYDSMIAKVIVHDDDRRAAIARAVRALEELELEGVPTTQELALDILRSPEFASGDYSTGYLDEMEAHLPSLRPLVSSDATRAVGRRQARRQALFLLYQWDLTGSRSRASSRASRTTSPRARLGRRRPVGGAGRADHRRLGGLARRPPGYARAEHPADRDVRARGGYGAARGGDQRGRGAREAVRDRGRGRLVNGILGRVQREDGEG